MIAAAVTSIKCVCGESPIKNHIFMFSLMVVTLKKEEVEVIELF